MNVSRPYLLLIHLAFLYSIGWAQNLSEPPQAKKIPKNDTIHGQVLTDNYYWLMNRENQDVLDYIKAENEYTDKMMLPTEALREKLYNETISRLQESDMSVSYMMRGYWYYTRVEKDQDYPVYCRKKGTMNGPEEILLDVNQLISDYGFSWAGVLPNGISPDNRLMAYLVNPTGGLEWEIYFKNLVTGELLSDTLRGETDLAWANDNKTIFYTKLHPDHSRIYKVVKHTLGTDPKEDQLVYHEKDSLFFVYVNKSKSGEYIFIESGGMEESEYRFISADNPHSEPRLICPREKNHQYYVHHFEDKFFIMTNKNAPNFKVVETSLSDPSVKNWIEVVPHSESSIIEEIEVFSDYIALSETSEGIGKLRVVNPYTKEGHYLPFEQDVYTTAFSVNPDFHSKFLRFTYQSLITPPVVYQYNLKDHSMDLLKAEHVSGFNSTDYTSERLWAQAKDGTLIPISLVYKKGMKKDGNNPLFLYGYGAYGLGLSCTFKSVNLNLLDRNVICAIAHVRGGNELGKRWHEEGKLLNKKNGFSDFIACGEHLISEGYTSKDRLVAEGGSAGGTLVGASINLRPDLFRAVVLNVPFVDVLNSMLNPKLPLTTLHYDEIGNPGKKEVFEYILSYSPYENVKAQSYPNMLFMTGMNDENVGYWEAAKMVAKLREFKTGSNQLLLKTGFSYGHDGASGRHDKYRELVFKQAFLLSCLDIWE